MKNKIRSERLKKALSETDEFRIFEYLVHKFVMIALRVTDAIADRLSQIVIALTISIMIQLLAVLNLSQISSIELTIRAIILFITIVCVKIMIRLKSLKIDQVNLFISTMISTVMISTVLNLFSSLKIYHSLIFKMFLTLAAIFWIASLINRGSDMYLDNEK